MTHNTLWARVSLSRDCDLFNSRMPPGTPYNSFVLPYRIRVDDFAQSATQDYAAALHLLSHTHTDHINGLSAQSFGYTVICSKDAKEMLLRHEVYAERELHEQDLRAEKTRTFSHLKINPRTQPDGAMCYAGSRDLLVSYNRSSCDGVLLTSFRYRKQFPWILQFNTSFQMVNLCPSLY